MRAQLEELISRLSRAAGTHAIKSANVSDDVLQLIFEARRLVTAIEGHRSKTGHEMCHENDEELWRVLNDKVRIDHTPPPWCEFMQKCALYRASKDHVIEEGTVEGTLKAAEAIVNHPRFDPLRGAGY